MYKAFHIVEYLYKHINMSLQHDICYNRVKPWLPKIKNLEKNYKSCIKQPQNQENREENVF